MSNLDSHHFADAVSAYQAKDYDQAFKKFVPFAGQGDVAAQYHIGIMYKNGDGTAQNYALAAKSLRQAAQQGHTLAQRFLGLMYLSGDGVPEDAVLAYKWLNLAAAQGDEIAKESKAILEKNVTNKQIAEAQKFCREFLAEQE